MNSMSPALPKTAIEFMKWDWAQIEPHFEALNSRALTAETVSGWLADWSRLGELLFETFSRLQVATTQDTSDQAAERQFNTFLETIYPAAQAADQKLKQKLLASGLEPAGFEMPLRNMRTEAALFREENLPLLTEERKLSNEYDKIIGAQTVVWEGQERTLLQLRPVYQEPDRTVRERAWRLAAERQLADREVINALWARFMDLRGQLAANADFSDYRAFRWQQMLRFDYTPADCFKFHQAIETVVVPAARRIYRRRQEQLGLETLRPWDLDVDPLSRPALRPFRTGAELEGTTAAIFERLDPQLGHYFTTMRRDKLLDLDNRAGKAPGGYCTYFPVEKRPFIFMNAVGVHDDVQTLLHEAGHAFHVFECAHLPYIQQLEVGMEFGEVGSMAMELLGAPYLSRQQGGFYSEDEAARAQVEHLEGIVLFWPYMAVVDAFQHWVYEHQADATNPAKCDAHWAELWTRFMPGVDWSGLEPEMITGWHRKLHIHQVPFYYVEYGLAQLGAVQVWHNARQDQARALAGYRQALSLGGTVPLPQLFDTAGARFAFDAPTLQAAVDLIEERITQLETIG
jgi:oligoendopeptidase F